MASDLQKLGTLIDIVTNLGHRVSTSCDKPEGTAGGHVAFGCDAGGAFVRLSHGPQRMSLDDARTLIADLSNAVSHARSLEWAQERGMDRTGRQSRD